VLWRLLDGFNNCAGCVISIILAIVFVLAVAASISGSGSWSTVAFFVIVAVVAAGIYAAISARANRG
jgi:hypothetical protein